MRSIVDPLEDLRIMVECDYISQMRFSPYRERARKLYKELNLKRYTEAQIKDMNEYLGMDDNGRG